MNTGKIAATAAAVALTALIGQSAPAVASSPSDSNMAYVSRYVQSASDALQRDRADYAGHRLAAIADIARARQDIASALAYDKAHQGNGMTTPAMVNVASEAAFQRTQAGSDQNLATVKTYLLHALDMLRRDRPDYNGYRLKAISDLEAARDQITAALTQDVRTEQPGVGSDSNVRYTRGYIQSGINMLNQDARDYGGHRAAAVRAMQNADADLVAALRADRADESIPSVTALAIPTSYLRGQQASNRNIAYGRTYVEHAIDMLQKDQHDYNGYRAKAVQQLSIARTQLVAAQQFR